jgi:hypothetical protein
MEGFVGRVDSLRADGATARVLVCLFGREVPMDVAAMDLAPCDPPQTIAAIGTDARPDPTAILDDE